MYPDMDIDLDSLREALIDDAGAAAVSGFPAAMADVVAYEDADPEELLEAAERAGLDLEDFED